MPVLDVFAFDLFVLFTIPEMSDLAGPIIQLAVASIVLAGVANTFVKDDNPFFINVVRYVQRRDKLQRRKSVLNKSVTKLALAANDPDFAATNQHPVKFRHHLMDVEQRHALSVFADDEREHAVLRGGGQPAIYAREEKKEVRLFLHCPDDAKLSGNPLAMSASDGKAAARASSGPRGNQVQRSAAPDPADGYEPRVLGTCCGLHTERRLMPVEQSEIFPYFLIDVRHHTHISFSFRSFFFTSTGTTRAASAALSRTAFDATSMCRSSSAVSRRTMTATSAAAYVCVRRGPLFTILYLRKKNSTLCATSICVRPPGRSLN